MLWHNAFFCFILFFIRLYQSVTNTVYFVTMIRYLFTNFDNDLGTNHQQSTTQTIVFTTSLIRKIVPCRQYI
ncbi:hypothetical protein BC941DRAFT_408309 [Chlamydoabsidia padenii]|nr:hypothetical protein BC941DRAFT_408309 [Chlamydoabsidia padenii]